MLIKDLDVLEIGPGQFLIQLTYFSGHNRVVGVDSDVVAEGFGPIQYMSMLRLNGWRRTIKTVLRKSLGIDYQYRQKLITILDLKKKPKISVHTMDVRRLSLNNDSFDFVYSRSVLHHLNDPGTAIDEIVRVLRPGGVSYISIHPYTSATGCLDPRIYTARRGEVEGWPHLRPHLQAKLLPSNARINRLRLEQWRRLFAEKMPGSVFIEVENDDERTIKLARDLHGQGELREYSLQELLAGEFVAIWKRPGPHEAVGQTSLPSPTSLDDACFTQNAVPDTSCRIMSIGLRVWAYTSQC